MSERDAQAPYLPENLWGYGKRLQFVDSAIRRQFPGRACSELRVLDVGCGNGSQLAIPMANAGYPVTAVDPHQPSIEHGRRLAPGVRFFHGFVGELSPTQFDCVIISEVLEHLDFPEALLRASLPYLAERGLLIVTVPNGYGEFEFDRRLYAALQLESVVGWLRAVFGKDHFGRRVAGSDDRSPHIQRFTLSRLREMFDRHGLELMESCGTSLTSGPFIAHLFAKSRIFIRLNAAMADHVPLGFASGWMFALRRSR
jgi:2-polyprenyl-3-methyl-5-hydroxy-6-metoxy-1,4-benzoquinol methylase